MRNLFKINILALLVLLPLGACSEDPSTPQDENRPPTITFTYAKIATASGTQATLTVVVDDLDGDQVTVTWSSTSGFLNAADQGSTSMRWTAPVTLGTDTLTITASDGNDGNTTIEEYLTIGTGVSGTISSTVTWNLAGSPYVVTSGNDRLTIGAAGRLTIAAGVQVLIDKPQLILDVGGQLTSAGTAVNPVEIRANVAGSGTGFWEGILGSGSGPLVDLDYTTVAHAVHAVKAVANTIVRLNHCIIRFCSNHAILHESTGELTVENSAITNNQKSGIRVSLLSSTPDFITIRNDSVAVNGVFDGSGYVDGEAGISLDFPDPTGLVTVDISGNEISRNDFPGIRLRTGVFPNISNNGIFGNERFKPTTKIQIELLEPFPAGQINASNNWWGQPYPTPADSTTIRDGIVDNEDNSNIGTSVWVTPWLNSAP